MTRRTRRTGRRTRLGVAVVAALALTAGMPAYAGAATHTTAPHAADSARTASHTTVTLKIRGCDGCRLRPSRWIVGTNDVWTGKAKKVRHGKVRWSVRTSRLRGLTFYVERNPRAASTPALNAVPLVVTRYRGKKVGSRVGDGAARRAKRATACLRGPSTRRFTARVVVRYTRVDDPTGPGTVRIPRYYFKRTQRAMKPYAPTYHGTLAAQDVYGCKA